MILTSTRGTTPWRPALALCLTLLAGCTGSVDVGGDDDMIEPEDDPTDVLFDPDRVLEVEIEIDPADWIELGNQRRNIVEIWGGDCFSEPLTSPYTYFPATVTLDGNELGDIGVRKKGLLGSDSSTKPSLKLNLDWADSDVSYLGKDMLTLNNARQDPTYMDQCLGYGLFAAAGVPASRCNFAHVTVNGDDLGPYVQVESIRRDFLEDRFGDGSGNHYEGTLSDFRPGWVDTFESKENAEDREDLDAVVDALAANDDEVMTALGAVVDLDEFVSFWAVEVLVGHWDGHANATNNFHIYRDPATSRFSFIPWGIDALFDRDHPFGEPNPNSVTANAALAQRLYRHPDGQALYLARMDELLDSVWDADDLNAEIDRMDGLIRPLLRSGKEQSFDEGSEIIRMFIEDREANIRAELDSGPPSWPEGLMEVTCLSPVGELSCTFDTTWNSIFTDDPYGPAEMEVLWFDEPIPVLEAYSWTGYDPVETDGRVYVGLPGLIGYPEEYIYPQLLFPPHLVESGVELPVDWNDVQAYVYHLSPTGEASQMAYGSEGVLTLDEAEPVDGAPFSGSVTFTLMGWGG